MDKQSRKEMVSEYLNTKTEMGLYCYKCIPTGKCYIGTTQNTKAMLNGGTFRLNAGNHKCKNLQKDWNEYKEENFEVSILEVLEYDKDDDLKSDYSVELEILLNMWIVKLEEFEVIK